MTTDELLNQMAVLMHFSSGWDARAKGCQLYGRGDTPRDAMLHALSVRDGAPSPPPATTNRTRVKVTPEAPRRRNLFD